MTLGKGRQADVGNSTSECSLYKAKHEEEQNNPVIYFRTAMKRKWVDNARLDKWGESL